MTGRMGAPIARCEVLLATPGIGHNAGPPLEELGAGWHLYCWRQAHRRAWKTPAREIALARLARAEQLGMSYRQYTAVILDKGVFL